MAAIVRRSTPGCKALAARHGAAFLATLAYLLLASRTAGALPACQVDSKACVLQGKVGEQFCTNGGWSKCLVPGAGGNQTPTGPDPRCADRTAQGTIKCYVEQPDVTHHETSYPNIQFAPNDTVYVEADGCVQSGGHGNTWHRYVNPVGPNADNLYHGLIRIPTGTKNSALVRIATTIGMPITVSGAGVDPSSLFLHLGFEDDDYSDNGYYAHDDGPDDQCTYANDGYPAAVAITIFRGVPVTPPISRFDFDLASPNLDANTLMYNPTWSWQLRPANLGQTPNTSICHNFSVRGSTLGIPDPYLSPSFADCTDQADDNSVDMRQMCQWSGQFSGGFGGHVNWFPVTVEGTAGWGDNSDWIQEIFGDDDYTFSFTNDQPGNPLGVNGRPGLHVEFDASETIDHFTNSEWAAFHQAVNDSNKDLAEQYFDGHTILTGMYGLDTDHMKAELHPLFAIATRRDTHNFENSAGDEAWLMFVRNVGDEGFCSYKLWSAEFEDYTFRLPWREGMAAVQVDWSKTSFDGTDGTSGPVVRAVPPTQPRNQAAEGVFVSFHLGPVNGFPFVDGTLHLIWTGQQLAKNTVPGRVAVTGGAGHAVPAGRAAVLPGHAIVVRPAEGDEADDIERKLAAAVRALPQADRDRVTAARISAQPAKRVTHRLAPGRMTTVAVVAGRAAGGVKVAAAPVHNAAPVHGRVSGTISVSTIPLHPILPKARRAVSIGIATAKLARDAAILQTICTATHNAPAGLPATICTSSALAQKP
jgi:hypothetical protein